MSDEPIDLRAWRQFLTLAELLHFRRAAEALGMTQPPLTQAIQRLEARLGTPLFDRTRRRVALTPAGAALVPEVRRLLRLGADLPAFARDAAAGRAGRLRLGFVSTVGFEGLPEWLRSHHRAFPEVEVSLREATGDVQVAGLRSGELDAGFLVHPPGEPPLLPVGVERLSVGTEPLVLAVPRLLVGARSAPIGTLLEQPLVIFPRRHAPALHDGILAFCRRQGAAPKRTREAIQMPTIVNLVSAGLGVALVPRSVTCFRRAGVHYRSLPLGRAAGVPRWETSLCFRPASAAAGAFAGHLRAALESRPVPRRSRLR